MRRRVNEIVKCGQPQRELECRIGPIVLPHHPQRIVSSTSAQTAG
jgi:hypothetical protein